MIIGRYPKVRHIYTHLNQFDDLIDWLGYLTSAEYLTDVLIQQHGLAPSEARARVPKIIPHITTAISLINQSLCGPQEVSFIPAYYAILDLAKVYILLGPRHADLPRHRWHGATYAVEGKDSHSLLTEVITLKRGGALSLFYETLTGRPVVREHTLKMRDIYPFVYDVGAEYTTATNTEPRIVALKFTEVPVDGQGGYRLQVDLLTRKGDIHEYSGRSVAALVGLSKIKGKTNAFTSRVFHCTPDKLESEARQLVNCRLLYSNDPSQYSETAMAGTAFSLPEEFPIALLFFHMSSVARYKPELLDRLQQGKYWPILASAKRHSLRKFMLLFWSFIHNEQLIIHAA